MTTTETTICMRWKNLHFKWQSAYFKWMTSRYTAKDEWDPAGFQTYRSYLSFRPAVYLVHLQFLQELEILQVAQKTNKSSILFACTHFQTEMIQNTNLTTVVLPRNSNSNHCISCRPLSSIVSDLAQLLLTVPGLFFFFEKSANYVLLFSIVH